MKKSRSKSESVKKVYIDNAARNSKKVINTDTGVTYNSAKEAAEKEGIKQYTLTPKLNGTFRNNTTLKYL